MRRLLALLPLVLATACDPSPEVDVSLSSLQSCDQLERVVRRRLVEKMEAELVASRDALLKTTCRGGFSDDKFFATDGRDSATGETTNSTPSPAPAAAGEPNSGGATEYSGTNNQVVGVDEADFLKNDARYLYVAAQGQLHLIDAFPPERASVLARLRLEGTPSKLFVEGGRAVVFARKTGPYARRACTYGYDCEFTGEPGPTLVHFIDLSDPNAPKVTRTLELAGGLLAARRIGSQVFTAVSFGETASLPRYSTRPSDLPWCVTESEVPRVLNAYEALRLANRKLLEAVALTNFLPAARDVTTGESLFSSTCGGFHVSVQGEGSALTSVFSFDLTGQGEVQQSSIIGRPGAVYANGRSLYVVSRQRTAAPETSAVHRFALDGPASSPTTVRYAGSAALQGHVLNQFSMDEFDGHLRVATSVGRVPSPDVHSVVTVFDARGEGLPQTGVVGGIAPTEDIRSVRFVGERGYLVTFKKTDPLFTLDLANPAAPRVVGELKIPGFSTYLHPIGSTHLLAIGFEAEDHGSFAYFQGLQLQFFDVREPSQPLLLHKEVIGTRGSASAAATDHLAFNYFGSKELLGLPMAICEESSGGSSYGRLVFDGLLVYRASLEGGFTRLGGVAHAEPEDPAAYAARPWGGKCSTWWSSSTTHVQRSVFMDDVVYSVAPDVIRAQRLGALGTDVAVIPLEAP